MNFIIIPKTIIKSNLKKFCLYSLEQIMDKINSKCLVEKYDFYNGGYNYEYDNYIDSIFISKDTYHTYINDVIISLKIDSAYVYIRDNIEFGEILLISKKDNQIIKILEEDKMKFKNFVLYSKNA